MLGVPLEQFRDSNVALPPSYPYGEVVIVDQLGRDAVLPRRQATAFNGGVKLSVWIYKNSAGTDSILTCLFLSKQFPFPSLNYLLQ